MLAAESENEPVTAAATAMRYATIAAASLIMLSPSRMITRRRGNGRRRKNAAAAAAAGGATTAPNAKAGAPGRPGTPRRANQGTRLVTNRSWPTRGNRIGRREVRAPVPPHHAPAPRAGAIGRRLDARAGHAAVGTVPAVHRGPRRDRGHGGDVPRLQPRPSRRAGAAL